MSSMLIIQQKDAVHLITDAASYDRDTVVMKLGSKVTELPASGCVFATRGASWASIPLGFLLSKLKSLDDILEAMPGILAGVLAVYDELPLQDAGSRGRNFEITIAGWSDEKQALIAAVATTFEQDDPNDPQGLSRLPGYRPRIAFHAAALAAVPPVEFSDVVGRAVQTVEHVEGLDPITDGLAIFEAQRRTPVFIGEDIHYAVGGFAELTTVTREGVTRQILKEWPEDVVGLPIAPLDANPIEEVRKIAEQIKELQTRLTAPHQPRALAA